MINALAFELSDNVVGLCSVVLVMMIPIVAILSKHQLKMAALFRDQANTQNVQENDMRSLEMRELKAMIAQQAQAIDALAQSQKRILDQSVPTQQVDHQLQNRL